jgi:S-adenosyl-L-methionine hydrolase (adenosine-forming)
MSAPIITLTTDFGLSDHYVGTVKGVLLGINPNAQVVDICHLVQSHDVLDGALTVAQAYQYFPAGTVHMVVVDPGVGSARRPILAVTGKHLFVAPDNGVLSLVYEREERVTVHHVDASHYFLQPVSNTFHGRDIFAPIAAWVSKGVERAKIGPEITDYVRFTVPKPKREGNIVKGTVLKVDRFGNLVTNITPELVPELLAAPPAPFSLTVGKAAVKTLRTNYAQAAAGEVFAIVGSMGYLEISANRAPASQLAGVGRGAEVTMSV